MSTGRNLAVTALVVTMGAGAVAGVVFARHDRSVHPKLAPSPVIASVKAGPIAKGPLVEAAKVTVFTLVARNDAEQACSTDGQWCVFLSEAAEDDGHRTPVVEPAAAAARRALAAAEAVLDGESYAVWPKLVALSGGGFIAGVETRLSTSYSGGGGSATELRLFRTASESGSPTVPILSLPVQGSLLIRACFSDADLRNRGEACHDEYGFMGTVEIEPTGAGLPVVVYSTEAWAFPRGASREDDSTTRGPLGPADLVRTRDDACSFRRRFQFNPRTGQYEPYRPLPDCSAYTVP